jgi:hypothetical protein
MRWAEKARAAALAVQAERCAAPARKGAEASYSWNAYNVWLSRAKPLRDLTPRTSPNAQVTPPPQGTAPRD